MVPPNAVRLIIRHLDSLDRAVSRRPLRKRPWQEPALTSLLCDLLDADTQDDERLDYPLADLNRDLQQQDGLLSVSFSVETHEYGPKLERWVTQADLGFVVSVTDHLIPDHSWNLAWLLQAKRLTADHNRTGTRYSESSRFGGLDSDQYKRMQRLQQQVGVPFVEFLLYCPRPAMLDQMTRQKLAHLRNSSGLATRIFDYTLGLILHEELGLAESSLTAGIFVAPLDHVPTVLGEIHFSILERFHPLSWFLASHLMAASGYVPSSKS